ncbi:Rpn family recombination-promoting nuclease/putative transposase [Leptothoe spongobia]|uniref:Rpn family recombination-promoting nuclease/putative transposase n=1 Tax=Leptothoe spongobia TAU-MAC 1115 TaxID=1967444 RepID=A0A947DI77_9CYAN|nr:Rpn family recombination-promoting nuclease/putative transposase [Leptothoe spongobia TAU-MAC 1115]
MKFIDPKTDFAFKKIFGSEQSHDILISFLNGILYDGESAIADLDILNPYQAPKIAGIKQSYLDVKAKLATGETVIIEMQVLNVEGFQKRILYNAAKAYSTQLQTGQGYPLLNPVIALTITDFEMFSDIEAVISRFVLKEKQYLIDYPIDDLELVFVELPKFQQSLEALTTLTDKWIYFLQHADDFSVVPTPMGNIPAIQQAFELANEANLSADELDELEHQSIFIQDQRGAIMLAAKQEKRKIAARLLSSMADSQIAAVTELSLADIQALRQEQSEQ